jgi:hypothetical protein
MFSVWRSCAFKLLPYLGGDVQYPCRIVDFVNVGDDKALWRTIKQYGSKMVDIGEFQCFYTEVVSGGEGVWSAFRLLGADSSSDIA